jgi:hypothetical protein
MTDDQNTHEDIARLLREQGPVEAPPELAAAVMDEVRRIPRRHPARDRRVRRAAELGVAAAVLLAVGFGLSRVDLGGSSSSSSAVGNSAGGAGTRKEAANSVSADSGGVATEQSFRLSAAAARQALGPLYSAADAVDGRIVLTVTPSQFRAYTRRLTRDQASTLSTKGTGKVTVVLRRSP